MIRKLRQKFILVTMLSTFAVLFVILGGLNVANFVAMNSRADELLDLLSENDGHFPDFFMGRKVDFEENNPGADLPMPGSNPPQETKDFDNNPQGDKNANTPPKNPGERREDRRGMNPAFSDETPYATRFFSVKYNPYSDDPYTAYMGRIASVTEEDALTYTKEVISGMRKFALFRGYHGNYRYKITKDDNNVYLVVFLDMKEDRSSFYTVLRISLLLSGIGLLAVFLLVWFFSKKVFSPVEEAYQKQKRFITDASHELKTPLSIISANVEVLEMENEESKWSGSIKNQVGRMSGLVEQMVTLSRLDESDELTMAKFDLSEAVSDTAEGYRALAKKNQQDFSVDVEDGITLNGDEAKIRQMVGLLLDNAVKYAAVPGSDADSAKENPMPQIKLTLKRKGKKAVLVLYNTTDQVSKGNQDLLFERFYRPDASRNSKKGGSGIGLSIVKSVVEAHKGSITAVSEDGKSIRFTAELPLRS